MSSTRSKAFVRSNAQPWNAAANAAIAAAAVRVTLATSSQSAPAAALADPMSSSARPSGSSTNMNGSRNAGSVYFQQCSVVLYGSPPVIAAAANGDSAVGGDTSDSTA